MTFVVVSDCTLREGEQQPGVILDTEAKLKVASLLRELGLRRVEVGTPAVSEHEREAISAVTSVGLIPETLAVCRANTSDIDLAARCGVWGVVISSPVSPYQLEGKLAWSLDEMVNRAVAAHEYARSRELQTWASAYDTFRTPWKSLVRIYGELVKRGLPIGIRMVDTVGVATPTTVRKLARRLQREFGLPIDAHFHDDFGLAMANALMAVSAGCESISPSVAGVGERAGNVATEELIAALEVLYGISTGVHLERLGPISAEIVRILGIPVADQKAIIGRNAFRHVAGLSVGGYLKAPLAAQPVEAAMFGLETKIELGKTSGHAALEYRLRRLGISLPEDEIASLLTRIKTWSEAHRRLMSDAEMLRMLWARDHISSAHLEEV